MRFCMTGVAPQVTVLGALEDVLGFCRNEASTYLGCALCRRSSIIAHTLRHVILDMLGTDLWFFCYPNLPLGNLLASTLFLGDHGTILGHLGAQEKGTLESRLRYFSICVFSGLDFKSFWVPLDQTRGMCSCLFPVFFHVCS